MRTKLLAIAQVVWLLLGAVVPAALGAEIDLTKAVVVAPAGLSKPERKAVETLVDEVRKRTLVRWDVRPDRPADGTPVVAVGTARDHVAPWRSVYKLTLHTASDVTFLLTTGGHNAGIVSEPGRARRSYQVSTKSAGENYVDPDTWQAATRRRDGSWWPEWQSWLAGGSSRAAEPPSMGAPDRGYAPPRQL